MSRSGYSDDGDIDQWQSIMWAGRVASALRGRRGQAFLRELLAALDAMPEKVLTVGELQSDGAFCTLGVIGQARGMDLSKIDTTDWEQLSREFGIAEAMAREVMYQNDDAIDDHRWVDVEICGPMRERYVWRESGNRYIETHWRTFSEPVDRVGERRWQYMRDWVAKQIRSAA